MLARSLSNSLKSAPERPLDTDIIGVVHRAFRAQQAPFFLVLLDPAFLVPCFDDRMGFVSIDDFGLQFAALAAVGLGAEKGGEQAGPAHIPAPVDDAISTITIWSAKQIIEPAPAVKRVLEIAAEAQGIAERPVIQQAA